LSHTETHYLVSLIHRSPTSGGDGMLFFICCGIDCSSVSVCSAAGAQREEVYNSISTNLARDTYTQLLDVTHTHAVKCHARRRTRERLVHLSCLKNGKKGGRM